MKSFNILLITSFLLTACASSQVTSPPVSTSTPLIEVMTTTSITPTQGSPTSTSEATEEVQVSYDIGERTAHKERLKVELIPGLAYTTSIITDESLLELREGTVNKVYPNPVFENNHRDGETSTEAISSALAYTAYKCWQDDDASRSEASFEEYLELLKEAQESGDHSKVTFTIKANDMNTLEYDPQEMTNVDPFDVTIVFMDPIGTVATQNMQRLKDIRGKEVQSLGTGVLAVTDTAGNTTNKLFFFVETPTLGTRDRAMSRATKSLIAALSRAISGENETSWTKDPTGVDPFGHVPRDPVIESMLLNQTGPDSFQVAIGFDPVK